MIILLTGGLGFIGSHTAVELLEHHTVLIIDNLSNSKPTVVDSISTIAGKSPCYYKGDVGDEFLLNMIFATNKIDCVIHFAGLKSVNQSVSDPIRYYDHNIGVTVTLLKTMIKHNVKNIIFSSSATVYGSSPSPVSETDQVGVGITNPYGQTKFMIEQILTDLYRSDPTWTVIILRYFNPAGAHSSGLLCEDPNDIPNNLMPYVLKVAGKIYPHLNIFGSDYETPDGTGLRDFIHVVDLAQGHTACIKLLNQKKKFIFNLGTGKPNSVKQIVDVFKEVNKVEIPYIFKDRRPGDLAISYAKVDLAETELGWKAQKNIFDICRDSWNAFQKINT
jgi:UDP-glucose 4-epimerase